MSSILRFELIHIIVRILASAVSAVAFVLLIGGVLLKIDRYWYLLSTVVISTTSALLTTTALIVDSVIIGHTLHLLPVAVSIFPGAASSSRWGNAVRNFSTNHLLQLTKGL